MPNAADSSDEVRIGDGSLDRALYGLLVTLTRAVWAEWCGLNPFGVDFSKNAKTELKTVSIDTF